MLAGDLRRIAPKKKKVDTDEFAHFFGEIPLRGLGPSLDEQSNPTNNSSNWSFRVVLRSSLAGHYFARLRIWFLNALQGHPGAMIIKLTKWALKRYDEFMLSTKKRLIEAIRSPFLSFNNRRHTFADASCVNGKLMTASR